MEIIAQLKEKLAEILQEQDWYTLMRGFFLEGSMDSLLFSLWQKRESGHRFIPQSSLWFRPFQLCPLDTLKVVVLNSYTWMEKENATGLALEYKKSNRGIEPVEEAVGKKYSFEAAARQGVLFLNLCITRPPIIGKEINHWSVWEPFMNYLIDMLLGKDLVFVLIGDIAKSYEDVLEDETVLVYNSPVKYTADPKQWDGINFPKDINNELMKLNKQVINW